MFVEVWCYAHLGYIHLATQNYEQAKMEFVKTGHFFSNNGVLDGVCFALEGLAGLALDLEDYERAAQLYGWTDYSRQTLEYPRPLIEEKSVDQNKQKILGLMGQEAYDIAYAKGVSMSMEDAFAYAIRDEG